MASEEITKKVVITGEDKTGPAFKSASTQAVLFGKSIKGVDDVLSKLGITALVFTTIVKATQYFKEGMVKFAEEADIINLMNERLASVGISIEKSSPQIKEFVGNLEKMGMSGEEAENAIGKFATKTRNLDEALRITKMAADLSASGYGSITDNVDRLSKVLTGNGSRALLEYGIKMEGAHSKAEQLDAIESKITRTTEEFGKTSKGQLQIAQEKWEDTQKQLGLVGDYVRDELIVAFNDLWDIMNKDNKDEGIGKKISKTLNDLWFGVQNLGPLMMERLSTVFSPEDVANLSGANKDFYEALLKNQEDFQKDMDRLTNGEGSVKKSNEDEEEEYNDLSDAAEKAAKKMKDAFTNIASKIVESFKEQSEAVKELRKELSDLDEETSKQLAKSEEVYQKDLKARAKTAQERINTIDKEIQEERNAMSDGWRTKIKELEEEKVKEQAIINRVAGEVSSLNEEIAKDELTLLQETHAKEIEEIKKQAEEKKKLAEEEIKQRETFMGTQAGFLTTEGLNKLMANEETFKGQLGYGNYSYVFNFNGDVNDKDALMRLIVELLNREATLKGVAGK